jgi:CDP-diacylglycerol---glycerol-3-phosphate 3-phosphatidyltransferase
VDLYVGKVAMLGLIEPLVGAVARTGVAPDALTIAAVPVAVAGSIALLASPTVPSLLLLIPVIAAIRLVLNLLDGAVARRTGRIHARGELLNELSDRLADVALLTPVAFLPGASPAIVFLGVVMAILASFVGVVAKGAGGERIYRGVLSKPGRMVLLSVASIAVLVVGPVAWTVFGPVLLVGAALTFVERVIVAWRALS